LGLAYFDLYYHFIAIIVITGQLSRMRLRQMAKGEWPPQKRGNPQPDKPDKPAVPLLGRSRKKPRARPGDRFATNARMQAQAQRR
ncbi:MAG: hypothetical protein AAF610_12195, partial [Pseudomonadota bacterium]